MTTTLLPRPAPTGTALTGTALTGTALAGTALAGRRPRRRHYLMCPPTFFDVSYAINPWMDPSRGVDTERALRQWTRLVEAYRGHGHRVDLLPAVPGLPDMVFAANGATVVDGLVLQARFAHPQRGAEAAEHGAWHLGNGPSYGGRGLQAPVAVNEAEGDFAVLSERLLAGYGFRTSLAAHRELAALTGRAVLSLELVDPLFYHLDVALTVLDDRTDHIAYYPPAFSRASQVLLAAEFPDAVIATAADAAALGLNCVSDGRHVFVPTGAGELVGQLRGAGYDCIEIDLTELVLGGGSVKCCTQEIRPAAGFHPPADETPDDETPDDETPDDETRDDPTGDTP